MARLARYNGLTVAAVNGAVRPALSPTPPFPSRSFATCPVARTPPMMCHGDDAKFVGRNLIDGAIGKPAKELPAPITAEDGGEVGIRQ